MLRWRLLLGIIFISALAVLFWLDHRAETPGLWLMPLALLLSVVATQEVLGLLAARGLRPVGWVMYAGNATIVASNWVTVAWGMIAVVSKNFGPLGWPLLTLALGVLLTFLAEMRRYTGPGVVMERLGLGVFGLCYVGLLLTFVCQLRLIHGGGAGVAPLASLVIVVKLCDVGAYTFGRLFGRHKMSPVLSPGKTVEGAVGGVALASLGSWLTFEFLLPALGVAGSGGGTPFGWLIYGVLVGTTGIFGDLAESLIKRDVGRKDSSTWMPGFGGVLDLLDSILFAAPVAYLLWALRIVG